MCKCCKQLQSWCKAFTKLERCLTFMEVSFLILFVPLLVLLILHLIACANPLPPRTSVYEPSIITGAGKPGKTTPLQYITTTPVYKIIEDSEGEYVMAPDDGATHEIGAKQPGSRDDSDASEWDTSFDADDQEVVSDQVKASTLALVQLKPGRGVVFGCMLTVVARYWALTTASCVEAVEEMDSLDSYTMLESYGNRRAGRAHAVADLRVHPLYRDDNATYDAAALRSADSLLRGTLRPARLATALHHALLLPGDRLQALVYGPFRGASEGRALGAGGVHVVRRGACAAGGGALRHLWAGRREGAAACGAARCVGALRAAPCNACGGAALVAGARVLALLPRAAPCGAPCDPFPLEPLTRARAWLHSIVHGRHPHLHVS